MTKAKNDTEGKGNLLEEKAPTSPLDSARGTLDSARGTIGEHVSGEETNKNPEEGAASNSSTDGNAQKQTGEEKGASAGEQASKKEEAPSKDKKKEEADAPKPKPSTQQKKAADAAKAIVEMMDANKVDVLFENSKGEFFTNDNLAHLSEKGAKDKVKCLRRETLEMLIKSVE